MIYLVVLHFFALTALFGPIVKPGTDISGEGEARLCEALREIRPGERLPIVVTGIYVTGHEQSILYDPEEPICFWDIQPSTWIEFAEAAGDHTELTRQMEKDRRALVKFKGELFGPKLVGPDDHSLSPNLAWANRAGGLRYGHLGGFRTKLVVQAVLEVRSVPESQPWSGVWNKPRSEQSLQSLPMVIKAETPHYPLRARQVGITGHVTVDLAVKNGRVVETVLKSGDRALVRETEENIRTWEFAPDVNGTLTTTFVYQLEPRLSGAPTPPRLELQLPSLVRIIDGINGW